MPLIHPGSETNGSKLSKATILQRSWVDIYQENIIYFFSDFPNQSAERTDKYQRKGARKSKEWTVCIENNEFVSVIVDNVCRTDFVPL